MALKCRRDRRKKINNDFGKILDVAEGYGGVFLAHEQGNQDDGNEAEEDVTLTVFAESRLHRSGPPTDAA